MDLQQHHGANFSLQKSYYAADNVQNAYISASPPRRVARACRSLGSRRWRECMQHAAAFLLIRSRRRLF